MNAPVRYSRVSPGAGKGGYLLGRASHTNQQNHPATGIRIQTSIQGRPIPLLYGQQRIAGNLVWYGGFFYKQVSTSGSKGGGVGGILGKGSGNYQYWASAVVSICEGPVSELLTIYNGNNVNFFVTPPQSVLDALATLGLTPSFVPLGSGFGGTFFEGTFPQSIWSVLATDYPNYAIPYPGEVIIGFANRSLGNEPTWPNDNYEILGLDNSDLPAVGPDANPADVIIDFLTNADHGVQGFPSIFITGNLTQLRTYCRASGLLMSPVLTDQQDAASTLAQWMQAMACDFFWSNGTLQCVPYSDLPVTGNGYTFTPNTTPVYNLTDDDFLENKGGMGSGSGDGAISIEVKDPTLVLNMVQVEYLNRNNLYNPIIIYASDEATIVNVGRIRLSDVRTHHFWCLDNAANTSAQLQLGREQITTHYQFTLGREYILLDPMDIVTLTYAPLGMVAVPVRIIEITENADDGTLTFLAEEYMGTVGPALYAKQLPAGTTLNYNAPPGNVNTPIIFEPPDQLGHGLAIGVAVSGEDMATWGGCIVLASYDNETYAQVGEVVGASRQGILTAPLPVVTANPGGQTIDNSSILSVNLTESDGELASGSVSDMTGLNTACLVDQEIVSYQNASLTGTNAYNLNPLVRGAYGTTIAAHSTNAPFARLDNGILYFPYTQDRIGATIYLKFLSYNGTGGGLQNSDDVSAYTYVITGSALTSPLPDVANLATTYVDGFLTLFWDVVTDFRSPIRYIIKKGSSYAAAVQIADVAHPGFVLQGADTYWVNAYYLSPTAPGLIIYSDTPTSIVVGDSAIVPNLIANYDLQAAGWPGTFTDTAKQGTDPHAFIVTELGLDIFTPSDIFAEADIFAGVSAGTGYYEIDSTHWVDLGYVGTSQVNINMTATGEPTGDNILDDSNILSISDILGAAATAFVSVVPQIALATTETLGVPNWGSWQNFQAGFYTFQWCKFRWALSVNAPNIQAVLLTAVVQVGAPERVDHYSNQSIPNTGLTITFQPDGAASPAPFNAGPNGATLPDVSNWVATTAGDSLVCTSLSLSGGIFFVYNSGSAVSRTGQSLSVEGY